MSKPLVQTTGRRKRAIARVSLRAGTGKITINGRTLEEYIPSELLRMIAVEPLRLTETRESYDVDVTMDGGGISGQAGALRLGIARALACQADIIILDEVSNGLDDRLKSEIAALINAIAARRVVIAITHDRSEFQDWNTLQTGSESV